MGEAAKLHHTVPQFYLRGFANDEDRIITVRLPGDRRYTQVIKNTAAINHFYSIDGHPLGADVFEKSLSEMEGNAAQVLRSIACGTWPLSEEQRGTLATFLTIQHVRGPDHRRTMQFVAATMARMEVQFTGRENIQRWIRNRYGVEVDDDEAETIWKEATRPEGPPIVISPERHIFQLLQTANKLLPFVLGRPWNLFRFQRRSLITCDSPVALVAAPEDDESWRGVGFLTAWGITVPLTRKLGLVMGDVTPLAEAGVPVERVRAGEFDAVADGTTAMERFINQSTVRSSSEYLYHHPDDESFLLDPLPQPRLSNISSPAMDVPGSDGNLA